ncbi:MAG: NUDIX hydrolase [Candidatus Micrarchaeaceae archaeon]
MSEIVYRNELFRIEESTVTMKDRSFKSHKIIEKDTVVILPITKSGYILLEEQYRPGMADRVYEVPSGHIDDGEDPLAAAGRELEEETGFKAGKITFATAFYSNPGMISKKESLYIAEDLRPGTAHFDEDEDIIVRERSVEECMDMVASNKIIDAKTIIALLYYMHMFGPGGAE